MTLAQPLAMKTRVKSPAKVCGIGGMGMKCKKGFEPKTTKPSPSSTRAMMVRIFMSGQSGSIWRKIQSRNCENGLVRKQTRFTDHYSSFFDGTSLFTSALVDFSKRIPQALSTTNVTTKINRNDQGDIGRIRSPSQMTYG